MHIQKTVLQAYLLADTNDFFEAARLSTKQRTTLEYKHFQISIGTEYVTSSWLGDAGLGLAISPDLRLFTSEGRRS